MLYAQVTGGRNGYGAKLANIFSTEFVIETCDGQRQRQYRQVRKAEQSGSTHLFLTCIVYSCKQEVQDATGIHVLDLGKCWLLAGVQEQHVSEGRARDQGVQVQ
jgi:hypothetical protein